MNIRTPKVIFADTFFDIDPRQQRLMEHNNPANVISRWDMTETGIQELTFLYDRHLKSMASPFLRPPFPYYRFTKVTLHDMFFHFEEIPGNNLVNLYNRISKQEGAGYVFVNRDLNSLLNAAYPTLKIGGTSFFVDLDRNQLRAQHDESRVIDVKLTDLSKNDNSHVFFYHPGERKAVDLPTDFNDWDKEVMLVEMPALSELDPIREARRNNLPDGYYIRPDQPYRLEQTAQVIRMSEDLYARFRVKNHKKTNEVRDKPWNGFKR